MSDIMPSVSSSSARLICQDQPLTLSYVAKPRAAPMPRSVQRLLSVTLAAIIGLLSAVPRNGLTTLHLAIGDHLHVLFDAGHDHHHGDGHSSPADTFIHEHDFDKVVPHADALVPGAHRHQCIGIGLPSGDYKRSADPIGNEVLGGGAALPPLAFCVSAKTLPLVLDRGRSRSPLGLSPPDLVASTVLLI
jgi:hypothetical protein